VLAGSSGVEPGVVPASDITLEWPTFSDAANQAGLSRRYGGIHFVHGDFKGRILGRKVAAKAWAKAEMYFEGSAGEPECEEQDPACRNRLSAK
jgi:hypothetical protein